MPFSRNPDLPAILDGLAQGVLIFTPDGQLVFENRAARAMLGADLALIRSTGFGAAAVLLHQQLAEDIASLEKVRQQALTTGKPMRFNTFRGGELQPCVVSGIDGPDNLIYTMITLETPDWTPLGEIMQRFSGELASAIESTKGHTELVQQIVNKRKPSDTADLVAKRIVGFNKLIQVQMVRSQRLMDMLGRLSDIRMGVLREQIRERRKRFNLTDFLEDLTEEINQSLVVDPESDIGDIRDRVRVSVSGNLHVETSATHLTQVLHDILANAIMYSLRGMPVRISAHQKMNIIQIDIADEGYGIRDSEHDRVFGFFQRARQPQIISEFGYGLSLYLCKYEVEAMNGRIWFKTNEGIGTTFSIVLPASSSSPARPDA